MEAMVTEAPWEPGTWLSGERVGCASLRNPVQIPEHLKKLGVGPARWLSGKSCLLPSLSSDLGGSRHLMRLAQADSTSRAQGGTAEQ